MKLLVTVVLFLASMGASTAAQGQPAQDPRSMGGGNCADNPYNCADAAESAARRRHGVDRGDDVDGRPRRAEGRQDHRHHPDRRHRAERSVARHSASTTTCCAPTAMPSRASSGTRCARRSSSSCPRAASSRRAATCSAPARSACARRRSGASSTDIARSLKSTASQNIIFIGDSGGNQNGQKAWPRS